jgi:alginate O-acetyltransferase complex protein AlgI
MIFNSSIFLAFFLCFYFIYLLSLKSRARRLWLILIGSFLFYGWWDWRFLGLIIFSIVVNHYLSILIWRNPDQKIRKNIIKVAVVVNLTILAFFKYFNFFIESFAQLIKLFNGNASVSFSPLNIILPVGISFFTFQAMSYVIDTYRGEIDKKPTIFEFAVYLSLFPQLVAGPIVRAAHLLPQIHNSPRITLYDLYAGVKMVLWGFFLKLALAENAAPIANLVFAEYSLLSRSDLLIGIFAFSVQIYGDFAGYSLIAIGLGRMMGFDFGVNFMRPYFAASFSDFWRRWHISLSTWLRDYLYIPLGGNKYGAFKTYRNLFITMTLGGLWHGASFNFIIWGVLHGAYLSVERILNLNKSVQNSFSAILTPIFKITYSLAVFGLVSFAWIFFRANSVDTSFNIIHRIIYSDAESILMGKAVQLIILAIVCLLVIAKDLVDEALYLKETETPSRAIDYYSFFWLVTIFFVLLIIAKFNNAAFIYFQF